jgi:hypothetical protein
MGPVLAGPFRRRHFPLPFSFVIVGFSLPLNMSELGHQIGSSHRPDGTGFPAFGRVQLLLKIIK